VRIFLTYILILVLTPAAMAEKVELELYEENTLIEKDLVILKLETKLHDMELEISDLKDRFEQIEHLQKRLLNIVGKTDEDTNNLFTQKAKNSEYQYAYNQIVNNKINRAERAFDLYIEKYPEDDKLGEVYFWKGEIHYKRKDYTDALEYYLISYQKYPDNERYLDSLFKMSVVLGFLGKEKEACEGFTLLVSNQTTISESLRSKALAEAVQFGCIDN
jgi:tetratricopeptide (TPR) repeat protein